VCYKDRRDELEGHRRNVLKRHERWARKAGGMS
jgi:hypothetical protein